VPKGRVEKCPVEGLSPQDADNKRADTVIEQANLLSSKTKPVLALMVWLTVAARADDWPQFRGPRRDGHWNETGILESFPKEGLRICWRHPVGGGFSSPV